MPNNNEPQVESSLQRIDVFGRLLDAALIRAVQENDSPNVSSVKDLFDTMCSEFGASVSQEDFVVAWSVFLDSLEGHSMVMLSEIQAAGMLPPTP